MNNTLTLECNITKLTLPSKMDSDSDSSFCSVYTEQELYEMEGREEFDIVNVNSFLIFRSINIITHGGKPPNCNGTANLYLAFGYYYSLQRYYYVALRATLIFRLIATT